MPFLKNILSKPWIKAILIILSVALPQILPLLPNGGKGAAILGGIYGILVSLGILAPPSTSDKIIPGSTILKG